MNIYVGNLPRTLSVEELEAAFAEFGAVDKVNIIKDKFTGESRGFGFVEMADADEAKNAIEQMNGKDLGGRTLNVNEARPKPERRPGGFGGNRGPRTGGSRGGFGGNGGGSRGGFGGGRGRY